MMLMVGEVDYENLFYGEEYAISAIETKLN